MTKISPALQVRIQEQKLNQNNSNTTKYVDLTQKPDTVELSTKKEEPKKKNVGKIVAIGLAISAFVVGVILAVKNKVPTKVPKVPTKVPNVPTKVPNVPEATEVVEKLKTLKLEEMTSDKFKQLKADKFTGQIEGKLKNGDNVVMEYINGILAKSTRSGEVNFEKAYKIDTTNGDKIVKKTVDGLTTTTNISKIQKDVKASQDKLKGLLKDNSKLSVEDFEKQTGEIKYKSKIQQQEINKTIADKKEVIKKAEAEKLVKAQEAELKAQVEAEEKIEKEVCKFKNSLSDKTDDELKQISEEMEAQHKKLWHKAQKLAKEKGIKSERQCDILETLNKEERQEYDFLARKISFIGEETRLRKYNYLDRILHKPDDKMVRIMDSANYGTEAELHQLYTYYDDYQCNDAYRGIAGSKNVDESLMDSLFKKAPALEEEATVYRAVSAPENSLFLKSRKQFIDSFRDGFIIDDPAYISTATKVNDKQFYQFASDVVSKESDGVLMRIKLPKGTKGVLGGHHEYLLPRNSKIKVNKINLIDGIKVADCEYILPS